MKTVVCSVLLLLSTTGWLDASKRDARKDSLAKYLARVQMAQPAAPALSLGSIWVDSGPMASLSADYKAMAVGDTIEIVVVQGVTSSNDASVSTGRTLTTSGGIDSVPVLGTGGAQSLLGLHSSEALSGKGKASSTTTVTTNLSGRVVAVLPNGNLVIEAERMVNVNHEKQTIVLRGVVRRGDIGPKNAVVSDAGRQSGTGDQGQGRDLGRGAAAAPGARTILRILDF